jgi:hypothetical protein
MSLQTFGWDTASVLPLAVANQALASNPPGVPQAFQCAQGSTTVHGRYQNWQLIPGVEGTNLTVQLNIETGTLSTQGASAPLAGIGVRVLVNLALLPDSGTANLRFDLSTPVQPGGVVDPHHVLTADQAEILALLMAACLNANPGEITMSFAALNFAQPGSRSPFSPVLSRFQYLATPSKPDGCLVILSSVVQRDISKLPLVADPVLLASGGPGFLISARDVLQRVLEPTLPAFLGGQTSVDDFYYSESPAPPKLLNKQPFTIAPVDNSYLPVVQTFTLQIEGAVISLSMTGSCEVEGGIKILWTASSSSAVLYVDGFRVVEDQKPKVTTKVVSADGPSANSGVVIGQLVQLLTKAITSDLVAAVNPMIFAISLIESIHSALSGAIGIVGGEMNDGLLIEGAAAQ